MRGPHPHQPVVADKMIVMCELLHKWLRAASIKVPAASMWLVRLKQAVPIVG
jgi:hypothetical protein